MGRPTRAGVTLLVTATLLLAGCSQGGNETTVKVEPSLTAVPTGSDSTGFTFDGVPDVVGTVATSLDTPWGIDFLPDGTAVVTERDTGRVLLVSEPDDPGSGEGKVSPIGRLPGVKARGEAGLLGVAVSPTFGSDHLLYFYLCTAKDSRVVRTEVTDQGLGKPQPVLTGIPVADHHNGGRIDFGRDGYLYVSTGDTGDGALAQNKKSLAGKVLRVTPDGKPAPGNPFGTRVWSLGHRNVEGLAFDGEGQLWATELGDHTADELNRIMPGENYGWPAAEGDEGPKKFTRPELTWAPDQASPSGVAFVGGYLWLAGLRGERLWRVKVAAGQVSDPTPYFGPQGKQPSTYGRLRTVALAPDGRLWVTTSNKDGRGKPHQGDDRILLIEP